MTIAAAITTTASVMSRGTARWGRIAATVGIAVLQPVLTSVDTAGATNGSNNTLPRPTGAWRLFVGEAIATSSGSTMQKM
eukprot:SAG31_NODE_7038_length_1807_cov_16.190867_3_plen_79_part_01